MAVKFNSKAEIRERDPSRTRTRVSLFSLNECRKIREGVFTDGIFCRGRALSTYGGEQEVNFRPSYPIHLETIKINVRLAWWLRRANAPARVNAVHYLRNFTVGPKLRQRPFLSCSEDERLINKTRNIEIQIKKALPHAVLG